MKFAALKSSLLAKPGIIVMLIGASALLSLLLLNQLILNTGQQMLRIDKNITWDITKGASVGSIVKDLADSGFVETGTLLKINLRLNRREYAPKVGHYEVTPGTTLHEFLLHVSSGNEKLYTITMVEGLTWQQWLAQLQENPVLVSDKSTQDIMAMMAIEQDSLEGLLLPESYNIRYGTTLSAFVLRMYQDMQSYLDNAWQNRQGMLPIQSPYEALILASIIEKETGVAAERPRIASVFVNRLREGMRLQTDPTVIYGLGDRFDGDLKRSHLREKTPFNTYVIKGLPPTPIAMPGKAAIDAALNPDYTDEFYFVSKGDGSHQFSRTLQEHNNAVRKYQLGLN